MYIFMHTIALLCLHHGWQSFHLEGFSHCILAWGHPSPWTRWSCYTWLWVKSWPWDNYSQTYFLTQGSLQARALRFTQHFFWPSVKCVLDYAFQCLQSQMTHGYSVYCSFTLASSRSKFRWLSGKCGAHPASEQGQKSIGLSVGWPAFLSGLCQCECFYSLELTAPSARGSEGSKNAFRPGIRVVWNA